jgi:hypothetical protein
MMIMLKVMMVLMMIMMLTMMSMSTRLMQGEQYAVEWE